MTEQERSFTKSEIEVLSMKGQMKLVIGLLIASLLFQGVQSIPLLAQAKDIGTLEAKSKEHDKKLSEYERGLMQVRANMKVIEIRGIETNTGVKNIEKMLDIHIKDSKEKKKPTK